MKIEDRIFGILCAFPYAYTTSELIEHVWASDDNEPDWAKGIVYIGIHRLKKHLAAMYPLLYVEHSSGRYRIVLRRSK